LLEKGARRKGRKEAKRERDNQHPARCTQHIGWEKETRRERGK
jgi:hypothetical protein